MLSLILMLVVSASAQPLKLQTLKDLVVVPPADSQSIVPDVSLTPGELERARLICSANFYPVISAIRKNGQLMIFAASIDSMMFQTQDDQGGPMDVYCASKVADPYPEPETELEVFETPSAPTTLTECPHYLDCNPVPELPLESNWIEPMTVIPNFEGF